MAHRPWVVYVLHHSHLDIGYTDPQPIVLDQQLAYLDQVLDLCATTDGWPEDSRFRWYVESAWTLWMWLKSRPAGSRKLMIQRIHEGRMEVSAAPMNLHTEACDLDELARGFEIAGILRRQYGIPITTAMQSDVPGQTYGFLDLLTQLGVEFLSVAHNYAGRSLPERTGKTRLQRPFYWQGPHGRLLVWYTDTPNGVYVEGNQLGLTESVEEVEACLIPHLERLEAEGYPYRVLGIRVQGSFSDNAGPNRRIAEVIRDWNERHRAEIRLRLATASEFAQALRMEERESGKPFPTFRGDWSDWWADGIGSAPYENGLNRKAHWLARVGAKWGAWTGGEKALEPVQEAPGASNPYGPESPDWAMLLFDEHTWGAMNPWDQREAGGLAGDLQWMWKRALAHKAHAGTLEAATAAVLRLGEELERRLQEACGERSEALARAEEGRVALPIWVFQGETSPRQGVVNVFLPESRFPVGEEHWPEWGVYDAATGASLPCQIERATTSPARSRGARLTFAPAALPQCGYRLFWLRPKAQAQPGQEEQGAPQPEPGADLTLENQFYRIQISTERGAVTSVYDKELGWELVDAKAPFQMNELIRDRYATAPYFNHLSSRLEGEASWLLGQRERVGFARVVARKETPLAVSCTLKLSAPGCEEAEAEIRLPKTAKRVEFINRLVRRPTDEKEALYYAFPFAVPGAEIYYDVPGRAMRWRTEWAFPEYDASASLPEEADREFVPGSCQHMKAIGSWSLLRNPEVAVAWIADEAPLVQWNDIHVPYAPFQPTLRKPVITDTRHRVNNPVKAAGWEPPVTEATVYSWASNNIWDTNFPTRQSGEVRFRYVITSWASQGAEADCQLAAQEADDVLSPILAYCGRPLASAGIPETLPQELVERSFISAPAGVRLLAFRKVAGGRFLVRLQDVTARSADDGAPRPVEIGFPGLRSITAAWVADPVGDPQVPLRVGHARSTGASGAAQGAPPVPAVWANLRPGEAATIVVQGS